MRPMNGKTNNNKKKETGSACEYCEYYDWNDATEQYECVAGLDQDELWSFISGDTGSCRYFKFYDEYKSVQKQN